jgi:hypothetical protein
MKHNIRIWTWKHLVPRTTLWENGTFVLGTPPLPEMYFTVEHMKNLLAGWVRMGAWEPARPELHRWFVSDHDVNSYDLLRRYPWK